ncbi:protein translocase subunit SecD [Pelagibius marinus]|uniref:protein translocase subunit SecD n=1 Tax=Pelagibius marinus TaxID=2762760 RepID=UPI001872693B|nr:protein translocase subunit SecD [Pelagibius marinus]
MVHLPRWQVILILLVVLLGVIYASPNLLFSRDQADQMAESAGWVPHQQISLGLDLRGGVYLLSEVDLDYVFAEDRENLAEDIRREFTRDSIGYSDLGDLGDSVGATLADPADADKARDAIAGLSQGLQIDIDDSGVIRVTFSEAETRTRANQIMAQAIEVVRRRIDELGTREASIQRHGDDRILIQVPGLDDPQRLKEIIGKTAVLTFRFVNENVRPGGPIPPSSEELPAADSGRSGLPGSYVVSKRVMVSGDSLTSASATFDQGRPVVSFAFDAQGAKRFGDATRDNVGKLFAIILDDQVISAPVINEPILGGRGIISGSFTTQEAQDLALLLRAGALPAPITYLEERTVGPGLGADSILAGEIASVLGLIFVVVFMVGAYGLFGALASVALFVNLILLMAALSVLQATLTLPGIAGIVLTIGMAVDANVLIFERIREEMRAGRGPVTAVDAGYRRAMKTIFDSNLTTLIAALLLFQFGSGPIKGFAVTLSLGLITSMFSAIMVTRLLVVAWLRSRRPQALAL